jgi:ABC-2 type transport system permease protein
MNTTLLAARAVAWRHLYKWITVPANFMPTFLFPLVFFTGFAGALGSVGKTPGFDYAAGYTSWIFVFSLLQTCLFGGLATGFTIGGDFQSGFARRLMLATINRQAIMLGYIFSTFVRATIMAAIVTAIAFVLGLKMLGGPAEIFAFYLLALTLSIVGTLWACGVMFRARDPGMGPAMQIPMFLAIFLAPVFVPLAVLPTVIHDIATYNPITYIMQADRNLLVGSYDDIGRAVLVVAALIAVLVVWGMTGVRSAERSGG